MVYAIMFLGGWTTIKKICALDNYSLIKGFMPNFILDLHGT